MNYKARQQNVRRELEQRRLDALLVTHLPNVRYLCGFTGSAAALLVDNSQTTLFTDGRYTTQARAEVQRSRVIIGRKAPLLTAGEWLQSNQKHPDTRRKCKLGIEADHLTVFERQRLSKVLTSKVQLRSVSQLVEKARMIKDSEEINRIRAAVLLGSKLFEVAVEAIRPGVRETQVAAELEYSARKAGAEGMSFDTIIASGSRSALPHARASTPSIPSRGFVVCDFGVILAGYCSDMTRTVHVGRPSTEARRIYEAVREAQQAAIAAAKPGVSLSEVDGAARNILKRGGLGRYFTHSTGHGVGLEIHEAPRVASGQSGVLQPGMVITIEPGVYIPGKWGVRIEDMVVITDRGCEVLTTTGKELVTV
jgi:Xaa-Pro aminopeptidase